MGELSIELFGICEVKEGNLDPKVSLAGGFWVVPMQCSFLVILGRQILANGEISFDNCLI